MAEGRWLIADDCFQEVPVTIREGRWRCPRCNRENLGRDLACQGCGDTRADDVRFYLPEEAPEVTDPEFLARAGAGADRLCEFCDASNPPDATVCAGCGAPLTQRQRQEVFHPLAPEPPAEVVPPPPQQPPRKGPSRATKLGCFGCLGALVLAGVTLAVGSLWQREVPVTVTGVSWQRSFSTERLVTLTRTAWKRELPRDARPLGSRQAQRTTRKVQTGTTTSTEREEYQVQVGTEKVKVGTHDLGNGFFEDVFEERPVHETRTRERQVTRPVYREEPVFDTEVTYQVDEWQTARTARAEGTEDEPRWPPLEPGEREQAGTRREKYTVTFSAPDGKRLTREVRGSELARFAVGSWHRAKVDLFGKVHAVGSTRVESGG